MRKKNFNATMMALVCCIALVVVGCGKKKSNSNNGGGSPTVDTWITETTDENGVKKISYASNQENAKFLCMIETDGQAGEWQDCPADGISIQIQPGVKYKFMVKAVIDGHEDAEPSITSFTGGDKGQQQQQQGQQQQGQFPSLTIVGEQKGRALTPSELAQVTTGTVNISFLAGNERPQKVMCMIQETAQTASNDQMIDCTPGFPLDLSNMPQGSYRLIANSVDSTNNILAQGLLNFCAGNCNNTPDPVTTDFLIGSWKFKVPQNMHITEYATTKTYNRQLSFYRVMADSDKHYIGNYSCNDNFQFFNRVITAGTPAGETLTYCHSTPTDRDYKEILTDYRLANNHLEVATDTAVVDSNPSAHRRISINAFDQDYEYMRGRSRFEYLCLGKQIKSTPPIVMAKDFWLHDKVYAKFYMCDTGISGSGNGLPGIEGWRVGTFIVVSDNSVGYPDFSCAAETCAYQNDNLLEITFMERPNASNWTPNYFARSAQAVLYSSIYKSFNN